MFYIFINKFLPYKPIKKTNLSDYKLFFLFLYIKFKVSIIRI